MAMGWTTALDAVSGWLERLRSGPASAAERLFRAGRFDEAAAAADRERAGSDSAGLRSLLMAGTVALWRNHLDAAVRDLGEVARRRPRDRSTAALLGEALSRQDRFADAAPWLIRARAVARARMLRSFGNASPYRQDGERAVARLLQVDPLPLVELSAGGLAAAPFLIDTGAGDTIVDSDVAERLALPRFGREPGQFGGGASAPIEYARLPSLRIGEVTLSDLPAIVMPTRGLLAAPDGRELAGIVGIGVLRRFMSTLDYAAGELRLEVSGKPRASSGDGTTFEVPFWLTSDHYLVAWGRANGAPLLFFVDTGVGGAGFSAPRRVLDRLGVTRQPGRRGIGGGGNLSVSPFTVETLSLGGFERRDVAGLAGVFPPALERGLGFEIGGLLGHEFFAGTVLTFDFVRMCLRITPRSR